MGPFESSLEVHIGTKEDHTVMGRGMQLQTPPEQLKSEIDESNRQMPEGVNSYHNDGKKESIV